MRPHALTRSHIHTHYSPISPVHSISPLTPLLTAITVVKVHTWPLLNQHPRHKLDVQTFPSIHSTITTLDCQTERRLYFLVILYQMRYASVRRHNDVMSYAGFWPKIIIFFVGIFEAQWHIYFVAGNFRTFMVLFVLMKYRVIKERWSVIELIIWGDGPQWLKGVPSSAQGRVCARAVTDWERASACL